MYTDPGWRWGPLILIGFLAALAAWQPGWAAGPKIPAEAVEHFNNGFFQAAKGNYDDAVREYQKAIKIFPQYAQAHHNLGMIFQEAGKPDLAIEHFRQALESPGLEKPWLVHNSLGIALESKGDLDDAIAAYRKAIELDPSPAFPQHNLALALAKKGDLAGALAAIRKAAELAPYDPRIQKNLKILQERAARQPETTATPTPPSEPSEPSETPATPGALELSEPPSEPSAPGPTPPLASPRQPERPLEFDLGTFWRMAEEAPGSLLLRAAGVEGLQVRVEWWEGAEGTTADLVEAELARARRLAPEAAGEPWPKVGGREAAAYRYQLAPFGVAMQTRVAIAVDGTRGYRFALSGAESLFQQGEAPFRALLASVRFK